jgi:hypothetical protein
MADITLAQEERHALKVLRTLTTLAGEHLALPTLFANKPLGSTAEGLLKGLDGLVGKGLAISSHDRFTFALTVAGSAMTEVTRDQFDVTALQATHRPTGAKVNWATVQEPDFHFATRGKRSARFWRTAKFTRRTTFGLWGCVC